MKTEKSESAVAGKLITSRKRSDGDVKFANKMLFVPYKLTVSVSRLLKRERTAKSASGDKTVRSVRDVDTVLSVVVMFSDAV